MQLSLPGARPEHPVGAEQARASTAVSRLRITYAITPPNRTISAERRAALVAAQSARIATLPIDALLVYDLQDEAARNSAPRPFPFVPKLDALSYAYDELRLGSLPRVVYRTLGDQNEALLRQWLARLRAQAGLAVFVGAPSRASAAIGSTALPLSRAFEVCREYAPVTPFGGVLIAERHQRSGDEDHRAWTKVEQGCRFFVTQTTWSVTATLALLRDLKHLAEQASAPMPTLLLTASPCGSAQTLAFQEWLGVHLPPPIKHDLLSAKCMLTRSVELAFDVFRELHALALTQGIAVGCNVESVSSRTAEVDASHELTHRVARYLAQQHADSPRVGVHDFR